MAKICFLRKVVNRNIQPHVPFKGTTAGVQCFGDVSSPADVFLKREWGWILRFSEKYVFPKIRKNVFCP